MTNTESITFGKALNDEHFNDYQKQIIYAILSANPNSVFCQEDILDLSKYKFCLLRKLGWYRRVITAMKKSLHRPTLNNMGIN